MCVDPENPHPLNNSPLAISPDGPLPVRKTPRPFVLAPCKRFPAWYTAHGEKVAGRGCFVSRRGILEGIVCSDAVFVEVCPEDMCRDL